MQLSESHCYSSSYSICNPCSVPGFSGGPNRNCNDVKSDDGRNEIVENKSSKPDSTCPAASVSNQSVNQEIKVPKNNTNPNKKKECSLKFDT